MTRKLVVISSLIVLILVVGGVIWTRTARGLAGNTLDEPQVEREPISSYEAEAVRETILRAWRIGVEARHTFDTSKYASVYINDSRGGEMTSEALALIQEIRQDPTIRMDQVGLLDYKIAAIENMKRMYEDYMAELRARQAAGTLHEEERLLLEGETYGWPTPEPVTESTAPALLCTNSPAEAAYPEPEPTVCIPAPTPSPTPIPLALRVPYRGSDPAILPPEELEIDIYSVEIEGEIAKAVVHKWGVTSEYLLVKVNGQWYIAGTKLLKFEI